MEHTLTFVYNADSGLLNALSDYAHKILSPGTYECSLCALTYGNLGMRRRWKQFLAGLGVTVRFLHRDELASAGSPELPAVFWADEPTPVIPAQRIRACRTLEDLEGLVRSAVVERAGGSRA